MGEKKLIAFLNAKIKKTLFHPMRTYLVNKDIDWLIAKKFLRDGRPKVMRSLNQLLIAFAPLTAFAKICVTRYQQLMCRYRQVKSVEELIPAQIHDNSFWHKAIRDFTTAKPGETIVFAGGHKGTTRQRLYILGILFGCRWTITKRQPIESWSNRGRKNKYSENLIDRGKLYTMKELRRLRMNLPDMWLDSDELNAAGEILYKATTGTDRNGRGWYKRGIMCKGPGIITFTKL